MLSRRMDVRHIGTYGHAVEVGYAVREETTLDARVDGLHRRLLAEEALAVSYTHLTLPTKRIV